MLPGSEIRLPRVCHLFNRAQSHECGMVCLSGISTICEAGFGEVELLPKDSRETGKERAMWGCAKSAIVCHTARSQEVRHGRQAPTTNRSVFQRLTTIRAPAVCSFRSLAKRSTFWRSMNTELETDSPRESRQVSSKSTRGSKNPRGRQQGSTNRVPGGGKLRGRDSDTPDVRLSKTLSWLLRHGAKGKGLVMRGMDM